MGKHPVPFVKDETPLISERTESLQRLIEPRSFALESSMRIGGQAKFLTVQMPENNWPRIELLHITDVQFGNKQCNEVKLQEYMNWILAEPYRFVLFGGDMCDWNTMLSVGKGVMEQKDEPDEQTLKLAELLSPIAHRVLGNVGGNHEQRAQKVGHDFGAHLASLLKLPYSSGVQHISVYYGEWKPFKIYLWHGRGAARTKGAKAQAMISVVGHDRANLYISGHTHESLIIPGAHIDRDYGAGVVVMEKYYCVSSTSFLNYYGTYGENAYYPPHFILMGAALIYPDGNFRISI